MHKIGDTSPPCRQTTDIHFDLAADAARLFSPILCGSPTFTMVPGAAMGPVGLFRRRSAVFFRAQALFLLGRKALFLLFHFSIPPVHNIPHGRRCPHRPTTLRPADAASPIQQAPPPVRLATDALIQRRPSVLRIPFGARFQSSARQQMGSAQKLPDYIIYTGIFSLSSSAATFRHSASSAHTSSCHPSSRCSSRMTRAWACASAYTAPLS